MRNKEQTKQNIIEAAITIFAHKGFLKASTVDIAKKTNVAHGTIFFHFPTKWELITACIYEEMNTLAIKLHEKSSRSADIQILCEIFLDEIEKHQKFYSRLVRDLPLLPISIQRMVFASLSGFSWHFLRTLQRGQRHGIYRKFSPQIAMYFWFGLVNYLNSYPRLLGSKVLMRKYRKEIIQFFVNAVKK